MTEFTADPTVFEHGALRASSTAAQAPYLEFVRRPDLSVGFYVLDVGDIDHQRPHTEDEVYVVVSGRAMFSANGTVIPVAPGDVIDVPAGADHRFVDIRERLELVVVFGPAEGTRSP